MGKNLNFEFGNEKNPKGNCFLYCAVINDNYYFPNTKWIASNVYVSYLQVNEKLPVVAFPPIAIDTPAELFQIAKSKNMDIIRINDFTPPKDLKEAKKYFQKRVDKFNTIVMTYVDLCCEVKKIPDDTWDGQNDLQKLNKIEKRFIQSIPIKDQSSLESVLGPYYYDNLIQDNRFDFQNLWAIYLEMDSGQTNVIHLFFEKYRAVCGENYEKAGKIQTKINKIINSG